MMSESSPHLTHSKKKRKNITTNIGFRKQQSTISAITKHRSTNDIKSTIVEMEETNNDDLKWENPPQKQKTTH